MENSNYGSTSSSSHASLRDIINGSDHNQAEIVRASEQYINQLPSEFVNGLETIPVTPEAPWTTEGKYYYVIGWLRPKQIRRTIEVQLID